MNGRTVPRMTPAERAHLARTWRAEFTRRRMTPPPPAAAGVAGYVRQQWAQPPGRRGVWRLLHDTFTADQTADQPDGGAP